MVMVMFGFWRWRGISEMLKPTVYDNTCLELLAYGHELMGREGCSMNIVHITDGSLHFKPNFSDDSQEYL